MTGLPKGPVKTSAICALLVWGCSGATVKTGPELLTEGLVDLPPEVRPAGLPFVQRAVFPECEMRLGVNPDSFTDVLVLSAHEGGR